MGTWLLYCHLCRRWAPFVYLDDARLWRCTRCGGLRRTLAEPSNEQVSTGGSKA